MQRGADSHALIEHLSAGAVVFRPDQTVARINNAARRFLGWGEGGANPALPEPLADVVMGMPMADGRETCWALCTACPENNALGGLRHVVLTFVDTSSLRQARQRQLQAQLAQSQKMETLGTLAGGVDASWCAKSWPSVDSSRRNASRSMCRW